jgi:uncharacterized protein (DUF1684 family)
MEKRMKIAASIFGVFISSLISNSLFAQITPYSSDQIETNYAKEIETHRLQDDASIRDKQTTLLSNEYFSRFTGLSYFPADIKYRVAAKLIKLSESERMNLDMTGGTPYGFMHYGKVSFFLDGKAVELEVFEFPSRSATKSLFVPFTDETSGEESFGGGRFILINIPEGDQIIVDFNLAINPICVYDPEHSCPIPPESNHISKRITAGVKMYNDPKVTNSQD